MSTLAEQENTLLVAMGATIVQTARALVGCGYIYGATGWVCTAARVEQQAAQYPEYADTIRKYGLGKWLGKRCYDCAQLTKASAKAAGVSIPSGATSQWKADVWLEKGTIDTLPKDGEGIFLYRQSGSVMQHTGIYNGDGTFVDARGHAYGVMHSQMSSYAWTHWARLKPAGAAATTTTKEETKVPVFTGKTITPANLKEGTTKLNLRETPGGKVVGTISVGETMVCLVDDGTWARCTHNGQEVYASTAYLAEAGGDDGGLTLEAQVAALQQRCASLEANVAELQRRMDAV